MNFSDLITPFAGRLNGQQLDQLLDAIIDNGQNWDASETDTLLLGVLRDGPGDAAPELPQPSAGDLRILVEEWARAGMRVDLSVDGDLDDVPDAEGRTIFRVVQEGLTNAHKHATDTAVSVSVEAEAGTGVRARVSNPLRVGTTQASGPPPGAGLGLVGLRERVELAGGRLSRTITPDQRHTLEAWVPWPT